MDQLHKRSSKKGIKMNLDTEIKISSERIKIFPLSEIKDICREYNFSVFDILSIAYAESSFRPDTLHNISGAAGLYQMKPWAVNRTGLKDLNVFNIKESTLLVCVFLDILRTVDFPKIEKNNIPGINGSFEKLMLLYHYGLSGTKNIIMSGILPEETKIYIDNIRKGKKISFEVLSKKN